MADERNPSEPDADSRSVDGTAQIPPADADQTSTFDPFVDDEDGDGGDDATQRVAPRVWAARAAVPSGAGTDDDLNYPAPVEYPEAHEPAPYADDGERRSRLTPGVIGAVVVVLLVMLGTGLYLIFNSSDEGAQPGSNVTAAASSATPTPSATAEPTPTGTPGPTATPTAEPTTQAPAPTAAPTTAAPPTPTQVPVPNLIGQTEAIARQQLTERGLVPQVTTQSLPGVSPKTVISTDPAPGTLVAKGTKVTVVVAAATSPSAAPPPAVASGAAKR